jgi:hypothetical protein
MKKIKMIALFVLGLSLGTQAQTQTESKADAITLTSDAVATDNSITATELITTLSDNSSVDSSPKAKVASQMKKWKERSILGKILVGTGLAIFIVICLLFGTVSVG